MARTREQHLSNLQQMFNDVDFQTMLERLKFELFEQWQRERKPEQREAIYNKMAALDVLVNDMRAAADSIEFEKQRSVLSEQ